MHVKSLNYCFKYFFCPEAEDLGGGTYRTSLLPMTSSPELKTLHIVSRSDTINTTSQLITATKYYLLPILDLHGLSTVGLSSSSVTISDNRTMVFS